MLPILDRAFDGIALITHSPWRLHFANCTLANWLGRSAAELSGMPLESVFGSAWWRGNLEKQLNLARLNPTLEVDVMLPMTFGSGGATATRVKVFHVAGSDPAFLGLVLRPTASLEVAAKWPAPHVDPLTALPDRAFLLSRLVMLLDGERAADREFAVLFIDLDNFKQVNDRNGHLVGDAVLREVAQRLQNCIRECDHVTRYGGDEFVLLLERVSGMSDIDPVLARIRVALTEPFLVPEEHLTITLSIGVALSAPHLRSPDDVLREADRAMYAAKRSASAAAALSAPATF